MKTPIVIASTITCIIKSNNIPIEKGDTKFVGRIRKREKRGATLWCRDSRER
jgi:hypothetical protein